MTMIETKTPAPLTAAEIEARKAIMAAADTAAKAETASPASVPQNAPSKPADKPAGETATTTAVTPEKLISKAPKPQGGKPTTANPHTDPVKPSTAKQGGTTGGKADKPKPAATPKAETKPANAGEVTGAFGSYDLSKWPAWLDCKPTKADLIAFWALGLYKKASTKNVLAGACYLNPKSKNYNVYDIATGLQAVAGGGDDHKMNVLNQNAGKRGFVRVVKGSQPYKNPNTTVAKIAVSYHAELTTIGRKLAFAALEASKVAIPKYMQPADTKPADTGKVLTPA
jgi:hypothetical protein